MVELEITPPPSVTRETRSCKDKAEDFLGRCHRKTVTILRGKVNIVRARLLSDIMAPRQARNMSAVLVVIGTERFGDE